MRDSEHHSITRRGFAASAAATLSLSSSPLLRGEEAVPSSTSNGDDKALIAITLDLEMSAGYPVKGKPRDDYPWDYDKGNLNVETKQYTVEACRRVKAAGGVLHSFVVGSVLEQRNVDWLKGIISDGHPVGNHTYDHVYILATEPNDIQPRFRRSPWLIQGREPADVIAENIRLCAIAMESRLGIKPNGFRAPGGFGNGLSDRPDVQQMIRSQGYTWTSCKYPRGYEFASQNPTSRDFETLVNAIKTKGQPHRLSSGLIEVPASCPTDVNVFRSNRWKLEDFLTVIETSVRWAIQEKAVYDFTVHPSIMYVEDPDFRAIDLICNLVRQSDGQAAIVGLDTIADRTRSQL